MYELKSSFLSTDKKCFSSKPFSNGSINVPLYSGNHTIVFSAIIFLFLEIRNSLILS